METLLLPGMDGTGRLFASFHRHLIADLRARVIAFPSDQPRGYDQLLGEIPVPAGPFAIVAESFSGPLGIRLAAKHPEQLRALVLVATFVRNPSTVAGWMQALLGRRLFQMRLPDVALRLGLLGMDAGDDEVSDLRAALLSVEPAVLAGRLREIISVDVSHEFATGTVPLLYIAGRHDRLVGTSVMSKMKRVRPDMETHVLNAPHLVLQRRPVEAAQLISEFLLSKRA
ncbi:MAG: alpha/beta fold hydrolase [Bacteroidota bacterium]